MEENVFEKGGQDLNAFYNQVVDKEAARGMMQAYLTKLNLEAKSALGLVVMQHGGAHDGAYKSTIAFPNLNPTRHTMAASDSPGRIAKVTDNLLFASAADADKAHGLLKNSDYNRMFKEYTMLYESLAAKIKGYKNLEKGQKEGAAAQILADTAHIERQTGALFSAIPEMDDIERILIDYETGLTTSALDKDIVKQRPRLQAGLSSLLGDKSMISVAGGYIPDASGDASVEGSRNRKISVLSDMILTQVRGASHQARQVAAPVTEGAPYTTNFSPMINSIMKKRAYGKLNQNPPENAGEILEALGYSKIDLDMPVELFDLPDKAVVQAPIGMDAKTIDNLGFSGKGISQEMNKRQMETILGATNIPSGDLNTAIGNVAEAAWQKSQGDPQGFISTSLDKVAVADHIAAGQAPRETKGGEAQA